MNCKKAQELMLTDYLDGEMNEKRKAFLEGHLKSCQKCKEFSLIAKKVGTELFLGAERANVPEYLWRRVRETVLAEGKKRRAFTATLLGKLKAILYMPKPALAIITVVILLIAIGTVTKINNNAAINAVSLSQAEYFDYLTTDAVDSPMNGSGSFGTPIEKYFM